VRIPEEEVLDFGVSIVRTVSTTKKHPQIGYIWYEGKKVPVYVGFWGDMPVWKTATGTDDPEYLYCAERTLPIEEDPDYIGDETDNSVEDDGIQVYPIEVIIK